MNWSSYRVGKAENVRVLTEKTKAGSQNLRTSFLRKNLK